MLNKISSMLDAVADSLEAKGLVKEAYEIDKIADSIDWMTPVPFPKYSGPVPTGLKNVAKNWRQKAHSELKNIVISDVYSIEGLPTFFVDTPKDTKHEVIAWYIAIPEEYDLSDEDKLYDSGLYDFTVMGDNVLGFLYDVGVDMKFSERVKSAYKDARDNAISINEAIKEKTLPLKQKTLPSNMSKSL